MTTRKAGQFCWINLLTPQPADARGFFGKLLGWTFTELPEAGAYIAHVGGHEIATVFDQADPHIPPGTPPHISVVIKVDDADAAARRVNELGGKAQPPMDVFDFGRHVGCEDPNGARFDLWQPGKMKGTDVDRARAGAPSWFETLTTDVDRAAKFYGALLGWRAEVMHNAGVSYTTFLVDGEREAGMMATLPQMGKLTPQWRVYFAVDDVDATARTATDLGGTLCVPPTDIPNVGRFCAITSPQGVSFLAIKYLPRMDLR